MERALTELERGNNNAALVAKGEARAYKQMMFEFSQPETEKTNAAIWKQERTGLTDC